MDMPKKIYVNDFLDGAKAKWIGLNTEYIRADLVNELIDAVDHLIATNNPARMLVAKNKLKALEAE